VGGKLTASEKKSIKKKSAKQNGRKELVKNAQVYSLVLRDGRMKVAAVHQARGKGLCSEKGAWGLIFGHISTRGKDTKKGVASRKREKSKKKRLPSRGGGGIDMFT